MNVDDCHKSTTLITKTGGRLILAGFVIFSFGCYARPHVSETGGILKLLSVSLKDGGHADIRLEKLERSYWAGGGWFQGAGGQPGGPAMHFYLVVTGTWKMPSGRSKEFTWIGPYRKHATSPYLIPEQLVITGSDVLIEYAAIPISGSCWDVLKYKRYKGTKWYRPKLHTSLSNYRATYTWFYEYVWEDVTEEEFKHATATGDVISLRANWNSANDVCYAWSKDCFTHCSKEAASPERLIEDEFQHMVMGLKYEEAEKMLNDHPEVLHTHYGREALHNVLDKLDLKRRARFGDKARRMLTLLYRFNPEINAVDSMNRTPLQVAVEQALFGKSERPRDGSMMTRIRSGWEERGSALKIWPQHEKDLRANWGWGRVGGLSLMSLTSCSIL